MVYLDAELDVVYDQMHRVIDSGGVQIKGLILRPIPSKPNPKPSLQTLTFAPFINNEQVSIRINYFRIKIKVKGRFQIE